jgi:hypothetical protein
MVETIKYYLMFLQNSTSYFLNKWFVSKFWKEALINDI